MYIIIYLNSLLYIAEYFLFFLKKPSNKASVLDSLASVLVWACNPQSPAAEAGGSQVGGQTELPNKTQAPKLKINQMRSHLSVQICLKSFLHTCALCPDS